MERDATGAGVAKGGLFSTADIKILICYLLSSFKTPLPVHKLADLLHYEGIANYFEIIDAINKLETSGHIVCEKNSNSDNEAENDLYSITRLGADTAKTLTTSLPFTVREKAYKLALKILARYNNERENKILIDEVENGYLVSCSIIENNNEMMTVRLIAADEQQANLIKQAFLNDASNIYSSVIELITNVK